MNLKNNKAFTLIEIMVGIIIVSIVLIGGFQALISITIGKSKLIQQTDLQKESFYFTEKLFEMIKKGGTLDYEEYFNRKIIGNNTYLSGHFSVPSGFGNFGKDGTVYSSTVPFTSYGEDFYYCRSNVSDQMTGTGCFTKFNSGDIDYLSTNEQERYGEYSFQFRDYNSNYDEDRRNSDNVIVLGDENGDGEVIGDDDDEYLGIGPDAFVDGINLTELYLISGNKKERTYFRWTVIKDPHSPYACSFDTSNAITGSGCLGTVEYLKLDGKDRGMDHDLSAADNTQSDGVIDTWIINKEFTGNADVVAGSGPTPWVSLFPSSINVSEFKILGYPNKDIEYDWKNDNIGSNISPYLILKMKLQPSWKSRKQVGGAGQELDFSMTINLSDIYSN